MKKLIVMCVSAIFLMTIGVANAGDTYRFKGNGDWITGEWQNQTQGTDTYVLPDENNTVRINWGNATCTLAGNAPSINQLQVGVDEGGNMVLNSGASLVTCTAWNGMGAGGAVTASLTINGGLLVISNQWQMGVGATPNAHDLQVTVNGGEMKVVAGDYDQSKTTLNSAVTTLNGGFLHVNDLLLSFGTFDLAGGTLKIEGNHLANVTTWTNGGFMIGNGGLTDIKATYNSGDDLTTVTAFPTATNEYFWNDNLSNLSEQPQSDDIGQLTGNWYIVNGGMHTWGGLENNEFTNLYNSPVDGSLGNGCPQTVGGTQVILYDPASPDTLSMEMNCDFVDAKTIQKINVFSRAGDGRLFTYGEVYYSTTGTNSVDYTLLNAVSFADWGDSTNSYASKYCVASLYDSESAYLAQNVKSIKIIFRTVVASPDYDIKTMGNIGSAIGEVDIIGVPEPGTQVSDIASDNTGDTSIELSWDNGNGEGRLIICRADEEPSSGPIDGMDYTANSTFGSGTSLGNGSVVYKDSNSEVTINGLTANTEYYFQAYEYNGDSEPNYNTDTATGNPISITTTPEPGMFFGIIVLGLSIIRKK